jgi:hypothetical protein
MYQSREKKIASLFLSLFFFLLSYVGENGDAPFIRRIGKENHGSYVVSINSSIKNHSFCFFQEILLG